MTQSGAICRGLRTQMQVDSKGQFLLMNFDATQEESSQDLRKSEEKLRRKYQTVEEDDDFEEFETQGTWTCKLTSLVLDFDLI